MKGNLIFGGFAAAVAGVVLLASQFSQYNIPTKSFDQLREASVMIKTDHGSCSGTLIEDPFKDDGIQTTILTAAHCGVVGDTVTIKEWSLIGNRKILGETIEFKAVARSTETDVMIFQSDSPALLPSVPIYGGTVSFGDRIFISGYGQGLPQDLTFGYAGFIEESCPFVRRMGWSSCDFLRVSNFISPGNSGSGVWKETEEGYVLVGVVSNGYISRFETSSRFSYAVTIDNLRSFIEKIRQNGLDPQPTKEEIEESHQDLIDRLTDIETENG